MAPARRTRFAAITAAMVLLCLLAQAGAIAPAGAQATATSGSTEIAPADSPAATGGRAIIPLMTETFEGTFPPPGGRWTAYDANGATSGEYYWDDDDFKPHAGSWSAWAANGGANGLDPATNNYPGNMDAWLMYGPIDLRQYPSTAYVEFMYWAQSEANFDYFYWGASHDGVSFDAWTRTSGDSGGWLYREIPLASYADDDSVWFGFRFTSDATISYKGPFVDDIILWVDQVPPGAFAKTAPANGATGQPLSPTLSWGASAYELTYQYCVDTFNNNACDTAWSATTGLSAAVGPLSPNTTYYWQVRAVNDSAATYANSGTWWSFTTPATAPSNDDFGSPVVIGGLPFTFTQDVAGATTAGDDPGLPCSSMSQKYKSVWYRYTAPAAQTLIVDTVGSSYDTLLAVWTGSRGSLSLVTGTCSDDAWGTAQSRAVFSTTPGTTYYIEAISYWSAPATSQLVLNAATFAKTSPADMAVGQPSNPTLSWGPSPGTPSYEYCYDTTAGSTCDGSWVNAGAATSAALGGLSPFNTYYWQVRAVSASGGYDYADANAWWSFTVGGTPVANDDFGAPIVIGAVPYTNTQDVAGATTAPDDPGFACVTGPKNKSVWYRYTPTSGTPLIVNTVGSNYDTVLGVWTGSRGSLSSVACNDDGSGTGSQSQVQFIPIAGTTYYIEVASYFPSPTAPQLVLNVTGPVLQEMSFRSLGSYDGWLLEQDETSGKGGSFDAAATTARVGDDAVDRQYRSLLHFDTSALPDTAVITAVTLKVQKQSIVGSNPFLGTHGTLTVDLKTGAFHDNPALENVDFHAVGSRGNVGKFIKTPSLGWYRSPLRAPAYPLISLTGTTQFRLRFSTDDNDNGVADYLSFYTGNAPALTDRPELIITYYVP